MKAIIFTLLIVIGQVTIAQNPKGFDKMVNRYVKQKVPLMSPSELNDAMNVGDILVLDTRELKEFVVSHLINARHVGYDNFNIEPLLDVPKSTTICLYCSIGYRSELIGVKLQKAGFKKVYNLYGGIFNWKNNGLPVYSKNQAETSKIHGYSKKWSKWINQEKAEVVLN